MVEVFKTNVEYMQQAIMLIGHIQKVFPNYVANFDLEDCDRIMRVECANGSITSSGLIKLMDDFGICAEVLPDDPFPLKSLTVGKGIFLKSVLLR
jgi:hypothetical protein